jgi:solute carrier family 25 uncoupling protein 8/9
MGKGDVEDAYLAIHADDGEGPQRGSRRRWMTMAAIGLLGVSCLAFLSTTATRVPPTSDAASSLNLAGANKEEEPAILLFALPLECTDLANMTLGKAGSVPLSPDGDKEKKLLDEKLADRALVVFPLMSKDDLDSATLGKGDAPEEGKKLRKCKGCKPKEDPMAGLKSGLQSFANSAFAACVSESVAVPFDTAKVRLQLFPGQYNGMIGCMGDVAKAEGVQSLWKGITPGIHRQILFGGLRIGLYEPVKETIQKALFPDVTGPAPLPLKILAGMATGTIAMCVASPTELVKVRIQAGAAGKYPSALAAYGIIAKEEGFPALWNGLAPNVIANSVINAAELAGYDQTKETLIANGMKEGFPCYLAAGAGAGISAVVFGSPFDVVKSKVLDDSKGLYKNFFDCGSKTLQKEGPGAFYSGWAPNLVYRMGWNMLCFSTLEAVKSMTTKKEPEKV